MSFIWMEAANKDQYYTMNDKLLKMLFFRWNIHTYLLLFLFIFPVVMLRAQDLSHRVTLNIADRPLDRVLDEIGRQSGILFSYNPKQIPLKERITIKVKDLPVQDVLEQVLAPLKIEYYITGKQVILKSAKQQFTVTSNIPARSFTISGFMSDSLTGEVLIGAAIFDRASGKGTLTNAYGFYSLTLPENDYVISCSILGYRMKCVSVSLKSDMVLNFLLPPATIVMQQVVITGEHESSIIDAGADGQIRLSSVTLKRMTGFAGNVDVIKSLQSIPGINAFGDGSAFYYVRGGDRDQNLMLIDEAPIFNPAHLFGFFSALAPDAIKDVKAFKGDLPASYGGRLSSVIDIHARDGNMNRFGFSGNIGIFTSDITLEGPLKKESSSFILSARKSNLQWLTRQLNEDGRSLSINFYDFNMKFNVKINDNNRIYFTGFTGKDDFNRATEASINTYGLSWTNATGTIRWNHIFPNKLFLNTTALFGEYNYYLYLSRELGNYWTSSIRTGSLKSDLTWFISPTNTYKAGIELSRHKSNPGNVHFNDDAVQSVTPEVSKYHSLSTCYYVSNDRTFFNKLHVKGGIRLSIWRDLGPSTVYFFDGGYRVIDTINVKKGSFYSPYYNLEPRMSVNYKLSTVSSLTAGYSRTVQYLQMLSNSTSPFTSLDVWAPAGPVIKPQKANQVSAGYMTNRFGIDATAELFFKKMYNQIEYEEHANMLYNPLIEGELRFGESTAYGLELLLKKSEGKFSGWIGYSFSRVLRTTKDLNDGNQYPSSFDHPHTIFTNLLWNVSDRVDIAASWIYMSGSPFTSATGFYKYNGYVIPVYGEKNNDRFPDYHRLDISATVKLSKPDSRYRHSLVFSLYNAYGRSNPFSVSSNKILDDNGNFVVPSNLGGDLEIVPTRISVAGIIPSINYTFKF
ncbi:MAG TPA: TonB-dependent receptor [Lentimicrobium sp.]|nr:TonB-dependent receptor [Lentimicrobium sp.]